ncbi:hypothetical protein AgCh_026641 [Apium graveolens]
MRLQDESSFAKFDNCKMDRIAVVVVTYRNLSILHSARHLRYIKDYDAESHRPKGLMNFTGRIRPTKDTILFVGEKNENGV